MLSYKTLSLLGRNSRCIWESKFQNLRNGILCTFRQSKSHDRGLSHVARNPIKLSFAVHGESSNGKEPIIIIHGLMGSKQNWNSFAKALNLKSTRKVICVDARNHGDSEHSESMTYEDMAADLMYLLTSENLSPAIVLGHSMGGRAAMFLALNHPSLVQKLVVVDISPVGTSPSLKYMLNYFEALRNVKVAAGTAMSNARKLVNNELSSTIPDAGVRQFLITNLAQNDDGTFRWRINLNVLESHFTEHIARFPDVGTSSFPKPTLFIAGLNSDYLRSSDEKDILTLFPGAQFTYIEGAGHWVHADKPHEVLEVVSSFIES